jgi:hypothetical protein
MHQAIITTCWAPASPAVKLAAPSAFGPCKSCAAVSGSRHEAACAVLLVCRQSPHLNQRHRSSAAQVTTLEATPARQLACPTPQ